MTHYYLTLTPTKSGGGVELIKLILFCFWRLSSLSYWDKQLDKSLRCEYPWNMLLGYRAWGRAELTSLDNRSRIVFLRAIDSDMTTIIAYCFLFARTDWKPYSPLFIIPDICQVWCFLRLIISFFNIAGEHDTLLFEPKLGWGFRHLWRCSNKNKGGRTRRYHISLTISTWL